MIEPGGGHVGDARALAQVAASAAHAGNQPQVAGLLDRSNQRRGVGVAAGDDRDVGNAQLPKSFEDLPHVERRAKRHVGRDRPLQGHGLRRERRIGQVEDRVVSGRRLPFARSRFARRPRRRRSAAAVAPRNSAFTRSTIAGGSFPSSSPLAMTTPEGLSRATAAALASSSPSPPESTRR